MLDDFQSYLHTLKDVDMSDLCTLTHPIWENWQMLHKISSINSCISHDINITLPDTVVSKLLALQVTKKQSNKLIVAIKEEKSHKAKLECRLNLVLYTSIKIQQK